MLLRKETIKLGDAEITVQGATGLSELDKNDLRDRLKGKTGRGDVHNEIYAGIVVQTVEIKNSEALGIQGLPDVTAPISQHVSAFKEILGGLPLDAINDWIDAIHRCDAPPSTDPHLQPDVDTKDPKSSESEPSSADESTVSSPAQESTSS